MTPETLAQITPLPELRGMLPQLTGRRRAFVLAAIRHQMDRLWWPYD